MNVNTIAYDFIEYYTNLVDFAIGEMVSKLKHTRSRMLANVIGPVLVSTITSDFKRNQNFTIYFHTSIYKPTILKIIHNQMQKLKQNHIKM